MKRLIVMTVGTSFLEKKGMEPVRNTILNESETRPHEFLKGEYRDQAELEAKAMAYLERYQNNLRMLPAELAALKLHKSSPVDDRVILVSSDTNAGAFCTRVIGIFIRKLLAKCNFEKGLYILAGLEAGDASAFQTGLARLPGLLNEWYGMAKLSEREMLINITGGYKGIIPFLAFYARKKQLNLYYRYEESDLIRIEPDLIVVRESPDGADESVNLNQLSPMT